MIENVKKIKKEELPSGFYTKKKIIVKYSKKAVKVLRENGIELKIIEITSHV